MQFLDNRVRFLYANFLVYMGVILLYNSDFLKIILVFSKVMAVYYGIFSILHGIINSNL